MDIRISDEHRQFIESEVESGRYDSAERVVDEAIRQLEARERATGGTGLPGDRAPDAGRSILDLVDAIRLSIPEDEVARLPVDGSDEHDHYIHGTPRRSARR